MKSNPGRRLFFWTLVLLFFITTATVLFLTFGYRFDTNRGLFVHTGSFTIKVTPLENVTIEVDGNIVPMKKLNILNNAFHIGGQMPGEHFIRVTAPGYSRWEKKAVIESGKSTEFWNITLIGNEYPRTPVAETESVRKIFPSPESNLFALLGTRDQGTFLSTFDTDTLTPSEIAFIPETSLIESSDENLEWSSNTESLLIPLINTSGERVSFLVNIETGSVTNLTEQSKISNIQYPRWDGRRKNVFYFLSENTLYEWSVEELDHSPIAITDDISGYDISQGFIYFIEKQTGIISRLQSGDSIEESEQITKKEIVHSDAPHAITVYDEDRIAIRNRETGELFVLNTGEEDYFQMIGTEIKGVQFSNDGKKLLFASDREILVYFVRPWSTQPLRTENEVLQIARFASPIRFVQWTKDYEHIIFTYNNALKTIELDHRDRRDLQTVNTFPLPPKQILDDFGSDRLFIIEEGDGPTLSFMPFPVIPLEETPAP